MQPQRFMEKLQFPSDSLEPMSCHLSTRPRFAHETSPNQTRKDKRRLKTIFNHFRDKPARYFRSIGNAILLSYWVEPLKAVSLQHQKKRLSHLIFSDVRLLGHVAAIRLVRKIQTRRLDSCSYDFCHNCRLSSKHPSHFYC